MEATKYGSVRINKRGYARLVAFLFVCLFFPLFALPQIIDMRILEPTTAEIRFSTDLVRVSKIKKITLNIANKPDLQVIDDKGLVQVYEFDSAGLLKRNYSTRIVGQEKIETEVKALYKRGRRVRAAYTDVRWVYKYDTTFTWFRYDSLSRMTSKRSNYGDFFTTTYYEYDKENRILKEITCKETNKNLDKHQFELGVQTILSSETFEYIDQSPTQVKKLCYNDDGKVYKQGIVNKDSNTVVEDYSFVVGYVRYSNFYRYDSNGRLVEKSSTSNSNGDVKQTWQFTYDEKGHITDEKRFRNEVNTDLLSYLYDEDKKLVKSRLDRDFVNASIEIVKFSYEFYP